jgi:hypothetical protein
MSSTDPKVEKKAIKIATKANEKADDEVQKQTLDQDKQREVRANKIAEVSKKRSNLLPS